jgi:DNA polymerase-3 subunit epsilon
MNSELSGNELERMANVLETTGDFRILRRLRSDAVGAVHCGPTTRAIFLDVETTGLNAATDRIIELAMLPFHYDRDDRVVAVDPPFVGYRDPGMPIPAAVTDLTGITDAMVAGASINPEDVANFVGDAALVVAHNAGFDRPFCERAWPLFEMKPWACTLREIEWAAEGFEGARLCHLAAGFGFFFDGHHAADDCRAGVEILRASLPRSGKTVLAALLDSARMPRWRIRAVGAPYSARATLKARGYRWNDGLDGAARAWFIDVDLGARETETEFLRGEIYRHRTAALDVLRVTAIDRYSERCR